MWISFILIEMRNTFFSERQVSEMKEDQWPCGAMVARLTPDQKVSCSSHVKVSGRSCSEACLSCREMLYFLNSQESFPVLAAS